MAPRGKLPRALRVATALGALFAATAAAQPDPSTLLAEAEQAERSFDFVQAEARYRAVVEAAPSSREARRARARLDYLTERRHPETAYEPLEALERARRTELDVTRTDAFAESVEAMPEGRVKRDSLYLLAETWLRRLDDPERAMRFYDALLSSPGIMPEERELARFGRAEALAALGDRGAAIDAMEEAGLGRTFEARELRVEAQRARLRIVALGVLVLALVALLAAGRPWRATRADARRALTIRRLLVLLYVVAAPAAIAELYERGTAETFLLFGVFAGPVLLLAALAAESLALREAGRAARAVVVAAAVLAPVSLAYLVLDQAGGLDSFGL